MKLVLPFLILVLLTSCSDRATADIGSRSQAEASRRAGSSLAPGPVPAATSPAPQPSGPAKEPAMPKPGTARLQKACGRSSIAIVGGDDKARTLVVTDEAGQRRQVADPAEMKGYVPRGLACATSVGGTAHGFVVEYGEEPHGCQFCEWRFLIDEQGTIRTHANPPILSDTSRPEGQQQYPNQQEFSLESKRLGLVYEEMDYVPAE